MIDNVGTITVGVEDCVSNGMPVTGVGDGDENAPDVAVQQESTSGQVVSAAAAVAAAAAAILPPAAAAAAAMTTTEMSCSREQYS